MNSEMQKFIDGYVAACERCNTAPERVRLIRAVLEDFKEYCKKKQLADKEIARMFMASKL